MSTYLLCTILAVVVQAFFAFFEMACVSFNKVRLQYYVSIGTKRALWIHYLLKSPTRLFGTTLIGITTALMIGSECSRRFYESIHLNPDWAPLTFVPFVVIFGELVPMFAARRHPEQAAMLCVPVMICFAKLLTPITWAFESIARLIHRTMSPAKEISPVLSREEVRLAFEERGESENEFNAAVSQIFQLKNLTAGELMIPLEKVQMIPSHATLAQVRHLLSVHYAPMLPIYHRSPHNIVAMVSLRKLLPLEEHQRVVDAALPPWFVTRDTSILQLVQQFRRNNQNIAVILDSSGRAEGILTLDQVLAQIFGEELKAQPFPEGVKHYIERTLSGEMSVSAFNRQFGAVLPEDRGETLSEFLLHELGHFPVKDESIRIGDFDFTIDELALLGIKTLSVRSILY